MVVITRRLPNSIISLKKALNKGVMMNNSLPAAERFLTPVFESELNNANTALNNVYAQEAIAEGNYYNNNDYLGQQTEQMRKYVSHFIQVMNLAIDRQDDNFEPGDRGYYQLPDATVPDLRKEADVFLWAGNIIAGETGRMTSKAGAVAMTNPDINKVTNIHANASAFLDQENVLSTQLINLRGTLNSYFEPGKLTISKLWNYVETQYLQLNDSARRNIMREWGVVFVSQGQANTLSFLVKDTNGNPLPQTTAVIEESGAETMANEDGRISLSTNLTGDFTIVLQYPGKQKQEVTYTIPEDAEGQTYNLPDVVLQNN